jgi:arabinofuranan 3-O-arabinosyltransferase
MLFGPSRLDGSRGLRLLVAAALAVVLAYVAVLATLYARHIWIVDATGHPYFIDFVAIWSSGKLALGGAAASTYDGHAIHAAEIAVVGHPVQGYLGWPYPPAYFFAAAALAAMPFTGAFLLWIVVTLALYAAATGAVARSWIAALLACAVPFTLSDLYDGQNGLLMAALMGGALLAMETRPLLAGVLLGLMTLKPQFGLLFPLTLLLDGRWRTIAAAVVTTAVLSAAAGLVFGFDTFTAFLHALPDTGKALVVQGGVGWNKLQTVYGVTRCLGGGGDLAAILQGIAACASIAATALLWRSRQPFSRKAAFLAAACLLATPYAFFYDLPVLAVATAFLHRERAFDTIEWAVLAAAFAATVAFVLFMVPAGLAAILLVLGLVVRRVWKTARLASPSLSAAAWASPS